MRNKRFRPDGLDLASHDSAWNGQRTWFLLLGMAILLAGSGFAALSFQELGAAQELEAERQSRIKANLAAARATAQMTYSRIKAAQAEARHVQTLRDTDWLILLTWLETAGKASGNRVVLLSLAPIETDAQARAVRMTGVALTEADMLNYMEEFRRTAPATSAELVSHQPEDSQNGGVRRLVFLLRWAPDKEKAP